MPFLEGEGTPLRYVSGSGNILTIHLDFFSLSYQNEVHDAVFLFCALGHFIDNNSFSQIQQQQQQQQRQQQQKQQQQQ